MGEIFETLVTIYQEFGLTEDNARKAAMADLEVDLRHVALAA